MAVIGLNVIPTPLGDGMPRGLVRRMEQILPASTIGSPTVIIQEVQVERPIYYRKRGYYPVSSEYEYWITEDPESIPPSGNPLIDITIVASYT